MEKKKTRIYQLLEEGIYSGEEFHEQRQKITKLIAEKESLLVKDDQQNIDMEEVLEFCFQKIRSSDKTWIEYGEDHEKRLRFQNFIFSENLHFSGKKFETTKLSPIYSIYRQYLLDNSSLVTSRGIEPRLRE